MAYQVTGNEYLSLPTIRENDGAVEGVTFLYMQVKGLLEIRGKDGLIRPYVELDGQRLPLCPVWSREHCWIPRFVSEEQALRFTCTYLTPVGERALVLRLSVQNQNAEPRTVRFGTDGRWDQTLHEVNETTELTEGREAYGSGWNHMFIFSQKPGLPLFAFAPCVADPQQFAEIDQQARWNRSDFAYDIYRETVLQPGETAVLDIPWGVGYEGVAASTSAKELLRQGFDAVYDRTVRWLSAREKPLADPKLHELLNTNLFFAFFYASGRTVDTEELCLMTSRSPRYYVSAAYWDRDSLLWAFPAILTVDAAYAREILTYDNALVCYALRALAKLLNRSELAEETERTRRAVYEHCVKEQNGRPFFAWSVDLNGHFDIYDEPPGSLLLLPFYGFCEESDPIWQNTAAMIRDESYPLSFAGHPIAEIGCKHAPHPWILSICNSLLSGHADSALLHLSRTPLDNGVACESVNEDTGLCETGEAFATCAGFLSYALYCACCKD